MSIAENGRAALDQIAGHAFDLVISDLAMPELGGQELFKELRAHHPALLTRFVFITGNSDDSQVLLFLRSHGCPVMFKPLDTTALLGTIEAMIERASEAERAK